MKIMQLRYFVEVCKYQNVTRAAKEMFISQPSVTSAIQDLEKEFGVNLFYRQSKRMILTKEGEFLYSQAVDILRRVDETARTMKNFGGLNNIIKVGIPPMIGSHYFPGFFNKFIEANPDVHFEIQEYGTIQTRELILSDQLDAAFLIINQLPDSNFQCLPLLDTEIVLAVSKENPLAKKTSVKIEDLANEPIILMPTGSFQNAEITRRYKEADIEPNVALYSTQVALIKQFAESNNASTFLFKDIVDADPDLVGVPLDPPLSVRVGLIWKTGRYIYNGTTALIDAAKKYTFGEGLKAEKE